MGVRRAFLLQAEDDPELFEGSLQDDDRDEEIERLAPVSERAALAWARARAEIVIIRRRNSDRQYSAGAVNPGIEVWPEPSA